MVKVGETKCPYCGGDLKHYDSTRRCVRGKRHSYKQLYLDRDRCQCCGRYHREIPEAIFPYKQYEAEIIVGVREGLITNETIGFEDFPCDSTMKRWRSQNLHPLL